MISPVLICEGIGNAQVHEYDIRTINAGIPLSGSQPLANQHPYPSIRMQVARVLNATSMCPRCHFCLLAQND